MFLGIDGEKLLLIGIVALLVVGPERLPKLAEALARFTVRARQWLGDAKSRVKDEMGEDFDDIEWRKLDPRQYDPRRIIRDALLDDAPVPVVKAAAVGAALTDAGGPVAANTDSGGAASVPADRPVPFDSEAT